MKDLLWEYYDKYKAHNKEGEDNILVLAMQNNCPENVLIEIISLFNQQGFKIARSVGFEGLIALHHAVCCNHETAVKILLDHNITQDKSNVVDFQDEDGRTPLHLAVIGGDGER